MTILLVSPVVLFIIFSPNLCKRFIFSDFTQSSNEVWMNECLYLYTALVQSLNSPFFPPHIGGWTRAGERRVQDNLHAHAQNEPIKNYQVPTTLLASMCREMPFSARALKENIFFGVDIVIKKHKNIKIEIWFIVVCTLIDNENVLLLFSQTFCSYCFCMLSDFAKVFDRKV